MFSLPSFNKDLIIRLFMFNPSSACPKNFKKEFYPEKEESLVSHQSSEEVSASPPQKKIRPSHPVDHSTSSLGPGRPARPEPSQTRFGTAEVRLRNVSSPQRNVA